jgi:hypothetical protein
MAFLTYADPSDLTPDWLSAVPSNAAQLIRAASQLVLEETALAQYDTDDDGLPTDPKVLEAFHNATCSQAAMWSKAKIDPDAGVVGQEPIVVSQTVPGGSVTYSQAQSQAQQQDAIEHLWKGARVFLRNAGLLAFMPELL